MNPNRLTPIIVFGWPLVMVAEAYDILAISAEVQALVTLLWLVVLLLGLDHARAVVNREEIEADHANAEGSCE